MSDLESIQPNEEGEETESGSLERGESQELNNSTHDPGARIEQTHSHEEAEAIESAFTELLSGTTEETEQAEVSSTPVHETTRDESREAINEKTTEEAPTMPLEIAESEIDVVQHTAVGKGPIPTFSPQELDNQTKAASESSLQTSEAVLDVIAKVLGDTEFREQFFSNPEEAFKEYVLTSEERIALGSLQEEAIKDFASEFEQREVGYSPPYVPVRPSDEAQVNMPQLFKAELTDEDINRLLGGK